MMNPHCEAYPCMFQNSIPDLDPDNSSSVLIALAGGSLFMINTLNDHRVQVPIGWPHAVANVAPNVKLAHDRLLYSTVTSIAHIHALFVSPLFASRMADDYVGAMPNMLQEVDNVLASMDASGI
eukprot:362782-Chlamydomonas_euryale.AAC.3